MEISVHCKFDEMRNVDSIEPYHKNRNTHPQDQIDRLANLFKYHGIRHPVIVDAADRKTIIAGHGRRLAAIRAGIDQVPVVYQEFESEEQRYAFVQSDNAVAAWAELDIKGINADLGDLGPDFDIDMLGIKDFTLDISDKFGGRDDDEIPESAPSVCKLGQIWQLGAHRLMCGDATSKEHISQLMNGQKVDMVFTDPPYGMFLDTDYTSMDSGMGKNKNFRSVAGDNEDFSPQLITTIFSEFSYCKEIFLFGADYYAELIPDRNKGSWVIWDKSITESMDNGFGSAWESCWSKAKHKRTFARILWRGLYGKKDDQKTRTHPTQKPVHLAEFFFSNWGKQTKYVADLYGGSGSTLIACEKTDRVCFMMELDEKYCDCIIKRYEKYTNTKAEMVSF